MVKNLSLQFIAVLGILNNQILKPYGEITKIFIGIKSHGTVPSQLLTAYLKLTLLEVCIMLCRTEHEDFTFS
jgi:hypothetical protein